VEASLPYLGGGGSANQNHDQKNQNKKGMLRSKGLVATGKEGKMGQYPLKQDQQSFRRADID